MEESTQPTSWRQENVVPLKKETEKPKPSFPNLLGQMEAVLMNIKKTANIAVSASILLVIFVAGWGGHMLWQWHNGLNEFSRASVYMAENGKPQHLVDTMEELGRVCRNDAHTPRACVNLLEKMEENPQLASIGRYQHD